MDWYDCGVKPSNRALLEALQALIVDDSQHGWSAPSVAAAVENPGARVRLARERRNDAPLGFVLAKRIGDLLEIDLVGVRAESRRRGIARSLLSRLIGGEAEMGLVEVRLELAASNDPARELYLGLGFMVVGRRTRYYPDGDDALLLTRMIFPGRSVPPQ